MTRREAVKVASLMVGGVLAAGGSGLAGCTTDAPSPDAKRSMSMLLGASDEALMESIADTILPETTASPGAKAAGCGAAINLLLTDCYDAAGQRRATAAIAAFRARAHTDFVAMSDADRTSLLRTINDESHTAGSGHWFHLLHELSTRTYFASEIGVTKALRYVREPGHFTGCVPITPGQPAWS